ncbi:MAG: alpha/beta fold hydrolase [Lentisphaeria bacterium]|nr:alpha/beta fold hydrolase [Lentisphaeria bacterium]
MVKMKDVIPALVAGIAFAAGAADTFVREAPEKYWDFEKLKDAPAFRDAPFDDSKAEGLRAVLVTGYGPAEDDKNFTDPQPKGLDKKVKAEFFAYIGFPEGPVPEGGFPGIVLIHGGGGTAYPQYTRFWVKHGYAVIALDWYNQRPTPPPKPKETTVPRTPLPGGKRQDHVSNVANMVLAHSLLRSLKNVNPDKTAFVGLSWGSWYGAIVASVDPRFKGGVEIYCGDVKQPNSKIGKSLVGGRFHHAAKIPLYWVAGTNDRNVTLESLDRGFRECAKLENKSLVIRLPHSHVGFNFDSCLRMAAHFTKGETGLPKLSDITQNGNTVSAKILDPGKGVEYAILCYTDSKEKVYHKRVWKSIPAKIEKDVITAELPAGAHQFFLSAYEKKTRYNDLCGSSSPVILPFPRSGK